MILISNIGNRNITLDGLTYGKTEWAHFTGSFRNDSCFLLEQPDSPSEYAIKKEFQGRVKLNILDKILDFFHEAARLPNELQLIYSDQITEEEHVRQQDTLYAAHIAQILIEQQWGIPVRLFAARIPISNQQAWLKFYRSHYLQIGKDVQVALCDSGGAPQQKHAMKIMAEFMLPPDGYELYYVNRFGGVSKETVDGYRLLITQEQALRLAGIGAYDAALALFNLKSTEINVPGKNYLRILRLGELIMIGDQMGVRKILDSMAGRHRDKYDLLQQLRLGKPYLEQPESGAINHDDWKKISLRFMQMHFFLERGRWNQTILATQVFFESLLESLMNEYILKLNGLPALSSGQRKEILNETERRLNNHEGFRKAKQLIFERAQNANPAKILAEDYQLSNYGTPFMIAALATTDTGPFEPIITSFSRYFSNNHLTDQGIQTSSTQYLNEVRNRIAHDGFMVENLTTLPYLPDLIKQTGEHLGFDGENTFIQLNGLLRQFMLQDC